MTTYNDTEVFYDRDSQYTTAKRERDLFENDVDEYTAFLVSDPCNASLYAARGSAFAGLDILDKALEDYTRALSLDDTDAYTYKNRGHVHYDMGNFADAVEDFTMALQKHGRDFDDCLVARGLAYTEAGMCQKACDDFGSAIKSDGKNAIAYCNRGIARHKLRKYSHATVDLMVATKINPKYYQAHYWLGVVYADRNLHALAVDAYTDAVKANRNYRQAYRARAVSYAALEKYDLASQDYLRSSQG